MVFEHQFIFNETNYLNFYANMDIRYAHKVLLHGLSAYGGSNTTLGVMRPGNSLDFDLAAEFSVTKKLALVMEGFFYMQQGSSFNGVVSEFLNKFIDSRRFAAGFDTLKSRQVGPVRTKARQILFNAVMPSNHNLGNKEFIGSNSVTMLTIAPAIEYSITKHMGLIGGAWLTLPGQSNTPAFVSPVLGFVASWE
jgi:hypothetical protein